MTQENAEAASIHERVGCKIQAPSLPRFLWDRHWCPRSKRALAPASPTHCQTFLSVKPVKLLPIDVNSVTFDQDMQTTVAEPTMLTGQFAQALTQPGIIRTCRSIAIDARINAHKPAGTAL